jgi:ABC-type dipeptide/oligopeptide/nickel transport system ATPase subunit
MAISWVDFSIANSMKPFSLSLEKNDFVFLAGETCHAKLLRCLAGFLPEESNFQDAIRLNGQRLNNGDSLKSVLLPKDATESFPPHRTIEAFALDLTGITPKKLEEHAATHGIKRHILHSKPSKISQPDLQKISFWLASLNQSAAIFIEEPEGGFFEECRPFDFLQGLLISGITNSIIYLTGKKDTILQKAKVMQFCRTRIAIFCADRLVEEGELAEVLYNPVHSYTKEWLILGSNRQRKNGALWQYCKPNCAEQHNCPARQSMSYVMWDCKREVLHKVACSGFF